MAGGTGTPETGAGGSAPTYSNRIRFQGRDDDRAGQAEHRNCETHVYWGRNRAGKIDIKGGHLMRLTDDGKVVEGWGFTDEQDVLDDFFSA